MRLRKPNSLLEFLVGYIAALLTLAILVTYLQPGPPF